MRRYLSNADFYPKNEKKLTKKLTAIHKKYLKNNNHIFVFQQFFIIVGPIQARKQAQPIRNSTREPHVPHCLTINACDFPF